MLARPLTRTILIVAFESGAGVVGHDMEEKSAMKTVEMDPMLDKEKVGKESRPIFGSLNKIVAEELSKHSLATVQAGLQNMPASESTEAMHRYIEECHLQAIDLFDIYNERSIFNPHFIKDPNRRKTVEEIYHNAIDAQTIREAIIKGMEEEKAVVVGQDTHEKEPLPETFATVQDLESLQEKLRQLTVRKDELEARKHKLQTTSKNLKVCEDLLDEIEKGSASDPNDMERIRILLSHAETANNLSEKAKETQEELKKRKRKGGDIALPTSERRKRASFGTRYAESASIVDRQALADIVSKIAGEE